MWGMAGNTACHISMKDSNSQYLFLFHRKSDEQRKGFINIKYNFDLVISHNVSDTKKYCM